MRMTLVVLIGIVALSSQSSGVTQTSAFTFSNLISSFSEITAVKTISENILSAPDLNYKTNGLANAEIIQPNGGAAVVSQGLLFSAENNGGLGGMASFYSRVTATQVKDASLTFGGTSSAGIWDENDKSKIISTSLGAGMAKPGEGEYEFTVGGNYETKSNTVPALIPIPLWENDGEFYKELSVTFEQSPLETDISADLLDQEMNFNYRVQNNQPTFYGYDFSRNMEVEDTSCSSWMSFSHLV